MLFECRTTLGVGKKSDHDRVMKRARGAGLEIRDLIMAQNVKLDR